MSCIFVFGESSIGDCLGYLSIDDWGEQKIGTAERKWTCTEQVVWSGKHTVCFYVDGKVRRSVINLKNGCPFLLEPSSVKRNSFEYDIVFSTDDALMLQVIQRNGRGYIKYQIVKEDDLYDIFDAIKKGKTDPTARTPFFKWLIHGMKVSKK